MAETVGADTVLGWAAELGRLSEEPGLLVRPYGSRSMARANELVGSWMRAAGMEVRRDPVGNLIGRYEGEGRGTLLLGSHLDTVRDAGRFDGALGVLVGLACVARLNAGGRRLPFALEVIGFADEEGLRFGTTYLGSSAFSGRFDRRLLEVRDEDGTSLAEAVRSFGGDPDALGPGGAGSGTDHELLGYCEVHIEQGPVLERRGLPVGVVSAIAGQSRLGVEVEGEAGHAGTVPMDVRHDALCAAAELVLEVESVARRLPGTVATVGRLQPHPGASNVIPGSVAMSLDLRHQEDSVRAQALEELRPRAGAISRARGVAVRFSEAREAPAVPADPRLTELMARAVAQAGFEVVRLPSGAGHDAAEMAAIAPIAMLFVRCAGGISHHPAESVREDDVGVAIEVLERFLALRANECSS